MVIRVVEIGQGYTKIFCGGKGDRIIVKLVSSLMNEKVIIIITSTNQNINNRKPSRTKFRKTRI